MVMYVLVFSNYHRYVSCVIVGSDDGVSLDRCQAIVWTYDDFSSIASQGTDIDWTWSRLTCFNWQIYTQNHHM